MQKTALTINGSKGKPITLDITYTRNEMEKPIVIFCHGFKGFKDWGHFNLIAETFAQNDFVFIKPNFSYNGTTTEQPTDFTDLEAFGNNNFSIELDDLGLVLDYLEANAVIFEGNNRQIYLMGHSRGGGTVILKANEDKRVKKLVTWASVKDANDFFAGLDLEKWKNEGVIYTFNSRTMQNMPLYYQLYKNYNTHKERLDIPNASAKIIIPWLILHGGNDTSVPYTAGQQLHHWNSGSKWVLIENADHTFGGKHPWHENQLPNDSKTAVEETIHFLKKG
ncbi:MAG: alpha/beta fold hydrolase [Sphingobacteriales bacterium]|nr:alpha/beta fold hydrolase [Sphingobacteriales bacterium]